jgi:RNA polymerase sigma factor (sigma-70 family)
MENQTPAEGELSVLADAVRLGRRTHAPKRVVEAANSARSKLMEAYSPLAMREAEKFVGKLDRNDAISAAYYGMALALRSWDPDKGALPSWIRLYTKMALIREVDKQALIKLPQALAPKKAMIVHLKNQGQDNDTVAKKLKLTTEQLEQIESTPAVSVWLDADEYERDLEPQVNIVSDTQILVADMLSSLSEDERLVVSARFGIGYDGLCHTYGEVADLTGLSIEQVQINEARGLAKLRDLGSSVL